MENNGGKLGRFIDKKPLILRGTGGRKLKELLLPRKKKPFWPVPKKKNRMVGEESRFYGKLSNFWKKIKLTESDYVTEVELLLTIETVSTK